MVRIHAGQPPVFRWKTMDRPSTPKIPQTFGGSYGMRPGHCVCGLTKELLNAYVAKKGSPKTRNEKRGVVKMFLAWCLEEDYLAPNYRLLEANGLKRGDTGGVRAR